MDDAALRAMVKDDELRRYVMDACPAGMVIVDKNGLIVDVNERVEKWFEYARDELLGQPLEMLLPARFAASHVKHRNRYMQSPVERRMETGSQLLARASDGHEFPIDISLHPLQVGDQKLTLSYIVNVDLAERQDRDELSDRAARLTAILENAVESIITIDVTGTIESVNWAAETLFGYSADELIGQNVNILMASPHREAHDGYITDYLDSGIKKIIGIGRETEGRHRSGETFPIELSIGEVKLRERRIFIGIVRDITERKRMEQAIRDERDFARSLIETAQAIVLVLDSDGRIVSYNHYTEELTGYPLTDVQGKDWFQTFIPQGDHASIRQLFHLALDGEPIQSHVNPIRTRDGGVREIAWWARALRDARGEIRGVLSVGHDLTELNQARQRALQAERLAAIGQMVTGLAHESRNAIQRAQACQEMLALDVEGQPELMDMIRRTQHALDDLHRLYEEVRGYATPIQLTCEDCHLNEIWRETWSYLELARSGKQVTLEVTTDCVDLKMDLDRHRIQQVFRNILENALVVSPDHGRITIHCAESELHGRPSVTVTFTDDGPGLTAEQQERMFEPFFTTKKKGTGLGMAIAKRIVDAHGGQLQVGRGEETGAVVTVVLPRKPA